ncbi:MAG: 3',5'-cyclic-nucleotide phosphodiesterase [Thermoanaerobaculia bacterium]
MKIEVLGAFGGQSVECRMTCLLLNERIALDAGCLAQALSVERQRDVHSVLLSHSHIDHVHSLPLFIDNIHGAHDEPVVVHASAPTEHVVRRHLLNNELWPDFARLPHHLLPTVRFQELQAEVPVDVEGLRVTPISVQHVVPTFGFLLEDANGAVLWSSDTGPTVRLWEIANQTPKLKAIFRRRASTGSKQKLADVSGHLTPRTLVTELQKLDREVPILLHHLKPPCVEEIRKEVGALYLPRVSFVEQGETYAF